jgi:hypothetical protein
MVRLRATFDPLTLRRRIAASADGSTPEDDDTERP